MGPGDFDYDVFADLFRGRGEGRHFRMPPQDVRYALKIDFLDAVHGWRVDYLAHAQREPR
jgi:hypothetical protein